MLVHHQFHVLIIITVTIVIIIGNSILTTSAPITSTTTTTPPSSPQWILSMNDLDSNTINQVLDVYKNNGMNNIDQLVQPLTIGDKFSALIVPAGGSKIRNHLETKMTDKVLALADESDMKTFITEINPPTGLDRIDSLKGLDQSFSISDTAGKGVDIYVIDSGIDTNHPDFNERAQILTDLTGEGENDKNGHGSHVSGTTAGTQFGIAKQASIFGVKVFGASGGGSNVSVLKGLAAVSKSAKERGNPSVVNMSLGGPRSNADSAFKNAIDSLTAQGVAVVVAAGNEGQDACNVSPAFVPSAITVAASDPQTDRLPPFSNFGACVDIIAPGVQIQSVRANSVASTLLSGTSMATPHVVGVMATLMGSGQSQTQATESLLSLAANNVISGVTGGDLPTGTPNRFLQVPKQQ